MKYNWPDYSWTDNAELMRLYLMKDKNKLRARDKQKHLRLLQDRHAHSTKPTKWKKAVIKVSWQVVVEFDQELWPHSEDIKDQIDFQLNDSSQCSSRYIDQLHEEESRAADGGCFSCNRFKGEFLRWASPDDILMLTPPQEETLITDVVRVVGKEKECKDGPI